MLQQELLKKLVHTLGKIQIEYMITGSIVSSLQGEPGLTLYIADWAKKLRVESLWKRITHEAEIIFGVFQCHSVVK